MFILQCLSEMLCKYQLGLFGVVCIVTPIFFGDFFVWIIWSLLTVGPLQSLYHTLPLQLLMLALYTWEL